MELVRSEQVASVLRILEEAGSTNDILAQLATAAREPHLSTVVTLNQTGGRGRLGRVWTAPEGKALAASVLLRLEPGNVASVPEQLGWLPLIAGAAMSASVDALVGGGRTGLKWPNDVLLDDLKVCGMLAELLPTGEVVMGSGVNLTLEADELPVPSATSLSLAGVTGSAPELADLVLSGYLTFVTELFDRFMEAEADAVASGIHRIVSEWCRTIGTRVRVSLPGDVDLVGVAVGLAPDGRLLVRSEVDDVVTAVAAGDVTHLRYA